MITCTVNAAMVFMLEKAESTMSCGSISDMLGVRGSLNATAATTQNRLKPSVPMARTVKGPEYALILTLVSLLIGQILVRPGFDDAASSYRVIVIDRADPSIAPSTDDES